jgi:hypothetical protein
MIRQDKNSLSHEVLICDWIIIWEVHGTCKLNNNCFFWRWQPNHWFYFVTFIFHLGRILDWMFLYVSLIYTDNKTACMFLNYTEWTYPLRHYWKHAIFTSRLSARTLVSWISVSLYYITNKRIRCVTEPNPYRLTLKPSVPWTWKIKYGTQSTATIYSLNATRILSITIKIFIWVAVYFTMCMIVGWEKVGHASLNVTQSAQSWSYANS